MASLTLSHLILIGGAFLALIAIIITISLSHQRRRQREASGPSGTQIYMEVPEHTRDEALVQSAVPPEMVAPPLSPVGARPSEDDLARAALGGARGDVSLDPAPMTRQRKIKTPRSVSGGGHTA